MPSRCRLLRGSATAWRVIATVLILVGAVSSTGAAEDPKRPRHPVRRVTSDITIDGRVIEQGWADALTLELRYEVRPGENVEPPVRTEMFLTFDDTHLLVAFKCYDPEPSEIRARFTDRDAAWGDDWVGVVLDTFNDERRAYELFVNPFGVQMDAINDEIGLSYDSAWNAIWDSAGRITADGYEVEMAVPFNQLRFQGTQGPQTWGIDGVRSYPRQQRYHIGLFPRLRGANSYLSQEEKVEGFDGVESGRNLELLPTLTAIRTDRRPEVPGGSIENQRANGDVGLTARWGITPNLTASLAANPDFSQVEADAVQLDVNNQFALFFPETRPFFLEGSDYFNQRQMNLVYSRTVADPIGALKATGKHGPHTYAVFSAQDTHTNVLVPGSQGSQTGRFGIDTTASVGRYRANYGNNSAVGMTVTNREGGQYFNRVFSLDGVHRFDDANGVSLTYARSSTQYDAEMRTRFDQRSDVLADGALELAYVRSTRNWFSGTSYASYGEGFRADLGFVTQVDYRKWRSELGRTWHGDGKGWFNQIGATGVVEYLEDQDGRLLERAVTGRITYFGRRETGAFVDVDRRDRVFSGIRFEQWGVDGAFFTRPNGIVILNTRFRLGDQIDFVNARAAREALVRPLVTFDFGRHWRIQYGHTFNALDVPEGRLFTANVAEPRILYQFNRRMFIRAILQYTDIRRNPTLYEAVVDAESRNFFTQLLFSYKVNAQTVLYVGYSDNYIGNHEFQLMQANRTFFVKAGYAWLL